MIKPSGHATLLFNSPPYYDIKSNYYAGEREREREVIFASGSNQNPIEVSLCEKPVLVNILSHRREREMIYGLFKKKTTKRLFFMI